jgi:hypothetical protein
MNYLSDDNYGNLLKMASITLPTKIHKTIEMAEKGELGNDASRVFRFLAEERYPGDRLAVSKFMADDDGSRLNNVLVRAERAAKIEHYNPANQQRPASQPDVEHPSEEATTGGEDTPNKWAAYAQEMAVAHANQNGISIHHAYDDLLKTSQYFRLLLRAAKGKGG